MVKGFPVYTFSPPPPDFEPAGNQLSGGDIAAMVFTYIAIFLLGLLMLLWCWFKQRRVTVALQQHEVEAPAAAVWVGNPPGLDADAITAVAPHFRYSIEVPNAEACSICLEEFRQGDDMAQLLCGHLFHHACIAESLAHRGACPNCNLSVTSAAVHTASGDFGLY
ncbi:Zinc finger RING/FYVE/PHD-type protein [Dioscorea alata]|uniref:Zinc finger RING/FYVE/PHD-type protein n=1 Tax=Dioscorea alata TaxID=55571 RepID=A0ACB7TXH4_DIOAL|nr:Zinc finger RING/FYVE/PHD-type protein [Dioscorea alata]